MGNDAPAPGPPSTNTTVTFAWSNLVFLCLGELGIPSASVIFSTRLGAITVLIGGVNWPDKWMVVRTGT